MRVLIFRDWLLPYSETFIVEQARTLQRYQPCFLGSRFVEGGLAPPGEAQVIAPAGSIRGRLEELGFKLTGRSRTASAFLEKARPSLIHAHFGPDGLTVLPLAQRHRIPLVVTFHGYDATVTPGHAGHFRQRQFFKRWRALDRGAARLIAVSKFIERKMVEVGFAPDRIEQHYIGVDAEALAPQPAAPGRARVVFAARLVQKKGCEHLIRAFRRVREAVPGAELVVIGDGPLRTALEAQARQLIPGSFSFLGALPRPQVLDWISRANVFCVPSVTAADGDSEGLGMVFLEAAALERPVVSFAHGGVPEAVQNGETGLLAAEGDDGQLAEHLVTLLRDPDLARRYGAAGRTRVLAHFNLRAQTSKLEHIYDHVV